jgi:hypothetical protein
MLILKRRTELPPSEGQTSHLSAPINFYLYQLHSVFTIIRVVAVAAELYAAHAILMPSILQDSTSDAASLSSLPLSVGQSTAMQYTLNPAPSSQSPQVRS